MMLHTMPCWALMQKNSIPCCIQVLGQQCGSQPRNRKRRSANGQAVPRNPITSEDQPKWSCHQWSSRPCNVILCATNGQARTQHVPVSKRYIAVAAEWRLTSFVLLWSTLGVQRLKMSYVVVSSLTAGLPKRSLRECSPPSQQHQTPKPGKRVSRWRRFGYEWSFQKASYFIEALDILYHLMISYGWKCLKKHP